MDSVNHTRFPKEDHLPYWASGRRVIVYSDNGKKSEIRTEHAFVKNHTALY